MYKSKKAYMYGTGRRKSSVARVHLFPGGTGAITINGRDINDYFRGDIKGSKKAFKDNIIREIETATLQLERRLDELDNQAHIVLNKLAT